MDNTLDQTTLGTISLLESRVQRIEHIIYGSAGPTTHQPQDSAVRSLAELERRFNQLQRHFRVYREILQIYESHPSLFQGASATTSPNALPPTQLSPEAVCETVLAYATAFPTIASSLTAATADTPIPDAKQSADLAVLGPRMRGIEALQHAQAAEMSELRIRSEKAVRAWYEGGVLSYGATLAKMEGRLEQVDRGIRRVERRRTEGEKV
ncbi:hypothetical protein B0J18DRAFT_165880 [Chaetomium sp. MPI-SDFR-AT-0129]|uniref:Uncharacterized protein n=1 Tax=Dichotomopilus funicola TaxID=1934379 RepID=A0AAN6UVS7_9PEZI|nr:hypothetical protein B0J18DRAFT_165880 [Chaetomium sp. MPI-SDFR-AT-0129]KAK4139949.1 hypothetical protein C8A04DRAFT_15377 [Dichotomopilus funicola]